jgi:hypothetical protein
MEARQQIIRPGRFSKLSLSLMTAAMAIAMASTAVAQNSSFLPDFSATEIAHVRGRDIASKVYLSGLNFRAEPAPGSAFIYLSANNTMYRVMFHGTQCVETAGKQAPIVINPLQLLSGVKVQRTPSGTEVIEGHPCKIENVVVTAADGKSTRFKLWEATDLKGIPVKMELFADRGEHITTYRDIVVGTPDAALFTPPKNCKPFEKTYQIAPPGK